MNKKYLKPGSLALGENNAKLNIWHGRYNGDIADVTEEGFFKAYFKMLAPGDIVHLVVDNGELDLVSLLVSENTATPDDKVAKDEFIKTKLISSTAGTMPDLKALKNQLKAEIAKTYGLKKTEE